MKKINLIEWLWKTDSHEKQKPQRFGRYAVMLIMLLTLGVGQMWAVDYYLDISGFTSWTPEQDGNYSLWDGSTNIHSSYVSTNLYKFTTDKTPTTLYFKRKDSGSNEFSVTRSSTYNVYKVTGWNAGSCANYNISTVAKTNYIYFNNATTNWSTTYKYFVIGHDKPSAYSKVYALSSISNTKLLYVEQNADDWSDLTYYGFNGSSSAYSNGSWGTSSYDDATKYLKPYTSKYDMNSGSSYYCVPSAAANNSSFSITYKDGYGSIPTVNASQAAKYRNTNADSYSDVSGSWPATLKLKGTYLNDNGSSNRTEIPVPLQLTELQKKHTVQSLRV